MRVTQVLSASCALALCLSSSSAWGQFSNIALESAGGVATQSSTRIGSGGNEARFAIDGNTNGNFGSGSVTHTLNELNTFWEVQLTTSANLENVRLFNRSDCCGIRLSNFRLSAFDGATEVFGQNFFEGSGSVPQGGNLNAALPFGTVADRVRVQFLGNNNEGNGTMSLAEVQVFGGDRPNLARNPNAVATQSSTRVGGGGNAASFAIDGNTDGVFNNGSVTHTNTEASPFWQVDLGEVFQIEDIVLHNRTDCCGDRLSDFRLSVLDNGTETYGLEVMSQVVGSQAFTLPDGILGDTVRVQLNGTNALSLAEVQVFGSAAAVPEPASIALWLLMGVGLAGFGVRRLRRK